jgi:predicted NUDIX family phosphoesterase
MLFHLCKYVTVSELGDKENIWAEERLSDGKVKKLHKEERMKLTGHVTGMRGRGIRIGYWWESHKERNHSADQDVSVQY